jgi:hypothetical protein
LTKATGKKLIEEEEENIPYPVAFSSHVEMHDSSDNIRNIKKIEEITAGLYREQVL